MDNRSKDMNLLRVLSGLMFLTLFTFVLGTSSTGALAQGIATPPKTRTDNIRNTLHGTEIVDPYRWLEKQSSPETRDWINVQDEYTKTVLSALPGREQIKRRLEELSRVDAVSLPIARGGRYFFSKRLAHQNLSVIYVRKGLEGADEVLIDPHPMSPDQTTSVGISALSNDGTLMGYSVRQGGADETTIHFMEVDTRKNLADQLPRGRYFGVSLRPDKSGFYYSRLEKEGPRVYYHQMGTDGAKDLEVFGKGFTPDKIIGAQLSEDGHYLLITVFHGASGQKTEIYYQDLVLNGPITPVVNDI
ncbi:MAG: S9 family peptidase, partial [Bacteroidota bacterium]